jgi:hypothetical protein
VNPGIVVADAAGPHSSQSLSIIIIIIIIGCDTQSPTILFF